MNWLVDPEIIEALYAASAAGVEVEIVARGICCLPRRPGLSERITCAACSAASSSTAASSRSGPATAAVWIGSADLMPRNLDRRIEVMAPIEDSRLRADMSAVLDALLADTRFSWTLAPTGRGGEQPRRKVRGLSRRRRR